MIGVQAWAGATEPTPARFSAPVGDGKKPAGGLWTSTWDQHTGSGWIQWCNDEGFRGPAHDVWLLTPDPAARVYTVDTYADLQRLHRMYGVDQYGYPALRWDYIAERYDAVHLTDDGQWATRSTHPYSLYGWDCESTLWLRWKFTAVAHHGLWAPADAAVSR